MGNQRSPSAGLPLYFVPSQRAQQLHVHYELEGLAGGGVDQSLSQRLLATQRSLLLVPFGAGRLPGRLEWK